MIWYTNLLRKRGKILDKVRVGKGKIRAQVVTGRMMEVRVGKVMIKKRMVKRIWGKRVRNKIRKRTIKRLIKTNLTTTLPNKKTKPLNQKAVK